MDHYSITPDTHFSCMLQGLAVIVILTGSTGYHRHLLIEIVRTSVFLSEENDHVTLSHN
jgi:hypothetical protein